MTAVSVHVFIQQRQSVIISGMHSQKKPKKLMISTQSLKSRVLNVSCERKEHTRKCECCLTLCVCFRVLPPRHTQLLVLGSTAACVVSSTTHTLIAHCAAFLMTLQQGRWWTDTVANSKYPGIPYYQLLPNATIHAFFMSCWPLKVKLLLLLIHLDRGLSCSPWITAHRWCKDGCWVTRLP